jgi:small subunit ribosomal protein S9
MEGFVGRKLVSPSVCLAPCGPNLRRGYHREPFAPELIGGTMASRELSRGMWRAIASLGARPGLQCERIRNAHPRLSRCIATTAARDAEVTEDVQEPFSAAPPIDFGDDDGGSGGGRKGGKNILRTLRVVPASPSYFSAKPTFTDDYLSLSALLRTVATLPTIPNAEAPKVAWKTIDQYRIMTNEPVKTQRYHKMLHVLRRLNCIHPSLMPDEVVQAMQRYKKANQPGDIKPKPGVIDELGRAKGVGRRKTSSAVAWLVEGEGEALINGKSLSQFFGRLHHRESAVWALKATHRLDKYNLFGLVQGGGSTGQAEALTLAVAKALLVHEPALKPALRRGKSTPALRSTIFGFQLRTVGTTYSSLTSAQPAASLVILERWKGRRQATSRPARCPPGSSVESLLPVQCIISSVANVQASRHSVFVPPSVFKGSRCCRIIVSLREQ